MPAPHRRLLQPCSGEPCGLTDPRSVFMHIAMPLYPIMCAHPRFLGSMSSMLCHQPVLTVPPHPWLGGWGEVQ